MDSNGMIINENYIEADEGKILYNGQIVATAIYLGKNDSVENWQEIDEETSQELLLQVKDTLKSNENDIKLIDQKVDAMTEQLDFYEDCITEMAEVVYE